MRLYAHLAQGRHGTQRLHDFQAAGLVPCHLVGLPQQFLHVADEVLWVTGFEMALEPGLEYRVLPVHHERAQGVEHGVLVGKIAVQGRYGDAGPLSYQVGGNTLHPDFHEQFGGGGQDSLVCALGALLTGLVLFE